jgi:tRNA (cmo5U34)-methyltransferase
MAGNRNKQKDTGDGLVSNNGSWSFDVRPEDFESHIERSVPFYKEGHDLIASTSDFFLPDNAIVYDIGTTTGSAVRKILARHPDKDFSITGLDVIPAMVDYAAEMTRDDRASFHCANALDFDYQKSHLFISYYTLQFIHPSVRIDLLKKIYESLHWSGALLLFDKVRAPDFFNDTATTEIYTEYKLDNDFSAEQIINKERSLKGVLEPFSENGNLILLREAGFVDIMTIYKWVNFQGWLAIK